MSEALKVAAEPTLIIVVHNEEPLSLGALAALLEALAKDYTQVMKRQLALRAARQGSLILTLAEFAEYGLVGMAAVVTMRDFTKIIADLVSKVKAGGLALARSHPPGIRTVRELVELSQAHNANIELNYERGDERLEVRMTRPDAEAIRAKQVPRGSSTPALPANADQAIREYAIAAAEGSGQPLTLADGSSPAFAPNKVHDLGYPSTNPVAEGVLLASLASSAPKGNTQRLDFSMI